MNYDYEESRARAKEVAGVIMDALAERVPDCVVSRSGDQEVAVGRGEFTNLIVVRVRVGSQGRLRANIKRGYHTVKGYPERQDGTLNLEGIARCVQGELTGAYRVTKADANKRAAVIEAKQFLQALLGRTYSEILGASWLSDKDGWSAAVRLDVIIPVEHLDGILHALAEIGIEP